MFFQIVSFGEWEENPRHQAKTLVYLNYIRERGKEYEEYFRQNGCVGEKQPDRRIQTGVAEATSYSHIKFDQLAGKWKNLTA